MKIFTKTCILFLAWLALAVACGKEDGEDSKLPKVKTKEMSAIRSRSATGGGIVESSGTSEVTQRGVCWSTNSFPTLLDAYTIDSSGLGGFNSSITGLTPNTEYYVRAYAINNAGVAYGNQIVFRTLEEVIPSENFWYVGDRPFIVNSLGSFWTSSLKTFGALATESGGIITLFFKEKPSSEATYKVLSGTTPRENLKEDECTFLVVFPGFGDGVLISTGKPGNTISVTTSPAGKLRVAFENVELEYSQSGEPKTTTTRGILAEK